MSISKSNSKSATLLIHCPDRTGLVSAVSEFLYKNNGNIIHFDQHVDKTNKVFFMRAEWELEDFRIPREKIGDYFQTLIAERFNMTWTLYFSDEVPKMAIFVSKLNHCIYDLLAHWQSGEWNVDIPLIIGNHIEMKQIAEQFGIEFYHFTVNSENKDEIEQAQIQLLKSRNINFIVLARYMQVLSDKFINEYPDSIINIHHSFLPAFPGAKPYHSAYERGVKIIGATSHYVTEELDAGPIIEQDVVRISHKDSVNDLIRKGRDLEKTVLSRAVYNHIRRKVLVFGNRTIVFE